MFGNKFNHRLKEEELSIPVMEKIDYIVMELKKMFAQDDLIEKSGYQNKTLMGILNINSEDVEWLMNSQNKLTKSYEIIMYMEKLGYSKEEVIKILKKGLTGIGEILKYYKTIYNGKINYSEKDLSILKRVQEIKRN